MASFKVCSSAAGSLLSALLLATLVASAPEIINRDQRRREAMVFKAVCSPLVHARLDPIVFPGQVSSHVHTVWSANTFGDTVVDRRDFGDDVDTTCDLAEDKSMYWAITVYQRYNSDGLLHIPRTVGTFYYLDIGQGRMYNLPHGLRMLTDFGAARWYCISEGRNRAGSDSEGTANFPDGRGCARLQTRMDFPPCWNGKDLDSKDHRSHLSHLVMNGCPKSHPFRIPQVKAVITYFINPAEGTSYLLADGSGAGITMHADSIVGFSEEIMKKALEGCDKNEGRGCPFSTIPSAPRKVLRPMPSERVNGIKYTQRGPLPFQGIGAAPDNLVADTAADKYQAAAATYKRPMTRAQVISRVNAENAAGRPLTRDEVIARVNAENAAKRVAAAAAAAQGERERARRGN